MRRRAFIIILGSIALAGFLVVGGAAAFVLRTPAASSGEFTAIPLETSTEVAQSAQVDSSTDAPAELIVGELVQTESEARFIVGEVLNGQPKTVVGVTNQVAAQIVIDPSNPANVQMGIVQANARTLEIDNGSRNRAIQNLILDTSNFEFITFTPTSFVGLPANAQIGDIFSFQILGDLTIRDVTRPVTFDVTVTIESDARMSGLATTSIQRADFDLVIPRVPQVASVEEVVQLELEFVAEAVQ